MRALVTLRARAMRDTSHCEPRTGAVGIRERERDVERERERKRKREREREREGERERERLQDGGTRILHVSCMHV